MHVFNENALDIVMAELDTVTDFTDYLTRKEAFVRSGRLLEAHGEENLLAYYAIRVNENKDHDFVVNDPDIPLTINTHHYDNFISNSQYLAKIEADKISYLWDRLIESFTKHMLQGTSITLKGQDFSLRMSELSIRQMALTPRFIRRSYAEAVKGALERGKEERRFFRVMMGHAGTKFCQTAFFIQTFKYLEWMENKGGYEHYRIKRTESAKVYARGLLEKYSHLLQVVGISMEPPEQGRGSSEDLIYAEQATWTQEERRAIREDCKNFDVLQNITERPWGGQEFPDVETISFSVPTPHEPASGMNRSQRRALKARNRKKRR
ncbi:hypothetical protein [Nisaea sp.]|uniref:hypothetical protein n=1 Tax=Nisaea sp. TaxID=2024842 RepID=UPI002B276B5B|nr:hypothetical protein [Nisaea sp.]